MNELINKKVKIFFATPNGELVFNCVVNSVDEIFIHFTDKYNKKYSFRISEIRQIEYLEER